MSKQKNPTSTLVIIPFNTELVLDKQQEVCMISSIVFLSTLIGHNKLGFMLNKFYSEDISPFAPYSGFYSG